jgi:hypothetical protein
MARKKGRRSKPYKLNLKKDTANSVMAVIIMGIGGLIAISFSQQGVFLTKVNEIGRGLLGWPSFYPLYSHRRGTYAYPRQARHRFFACTSG